MDANRPEVTSQMYLDVFRNAPFGIYTLDKDGIITSFNPRMLELAGIKLEEILGRNALEMESYKRVGLADLFRQGIAGQPFEKKVRYTSEFNHRTTIRQYKGVPIKDNGIDGQTRLLLIVEDVTEREKVQDQLESLADFPRQSNAPVLRIGSEGVISQTNDPASKMVSSWKQEGEQKSLDDLVAMAKKSLADKDYARLEVKTKHHIFQLDFVPQPEKGYVNVYGRDITREREIQNVKDHFLAVTSHELRTPMTVISGYADLMLKEMAGPVTDEQREYLQKIVDSSTQLVEFVNSMLDINKLESGNIKMELRPGTIVGSIRHAVSSVKALFEKANVDLIYQCQAAGAQVELSQPDLSRAVLNLLSNALKFTPSGGTVSLRTVANSQDVVISISDTGPGISEEDQAKLFQAYSQIDVKQLHKMAGTGLGLVISRELVEAMHGHIWVESQLGHGATFFISLPRINY